MGFATARTISLSGATGHLIDVQVDVSAGLVATAMVGRPDASISEARDRCRAALTNSRYAWPVTRRITILLRDWVRTQYRYPFKGSPKDQPVIATAIELATLNGRLMYIVTVHGDEKTARRLEALLVPTLRVDPNHPAAVGSSK